MREAPGADVVFLEGESTGLTTHEGRQGWGGAKKFLEGVSVRWAAPARERGVGRAGNRRGPARAGPLGHLSDGIDTERQSGSSGARPS